MDNIFTEGRRSSEIDVLWVNVIAIKAIVVKICPGDRGLFLGYDRAGSVFGLVSKISCPPAFKYTISILKCSIF